MSDSGFDRRIGIDAVVMLFIFRFEAHENRDALFDSRGLNDDFLESTLEGGIFFDVFSVFIERRGADALDFSARKGGL